MVGGTEETPGQTRRNPLSIEACPRTDCLRDLHSLSSHILGDSMGAFTDSANEALLKGLFKTYNFAFI